MTALHRLRLPALLAALFLLVAAYGGGDDAADTGDTGDDTGAETDGGDTGDSEMDDGETDDGETDDGAMEEEDDAAMDDEDDMAEEGATEVALECQVELPEEGPGSAEGMAEEPAATAASNNPELSTLVEAVEAAELTDTLNDPEATYTIFAPANAAFEEIPEEDLNALLKDQEQLTEVLTLHVQGEEEQDIQSLVDEGSLTSLQGEDVTVEASDEQTVTLNGGQAEVICPDVETANATVHIIDGVLMPGEGEMDGEMNGDAEMDDGEDS